MSISKSVLTSAVFVKIEACGGCSLRRLRSCPVSRSAGAGVASRPACAPSLKALPVVMTWSQPGNRCKPQCCVFLLACYPYPRDKRVTLHASVMRATVGLYCLGGFACGLLSSACRGVDGRMFVACRVRSTGRRSRKSGSYMYVLRNVTPCHL